MIRACLTLLFTVTFVVSPLVTSPFSGFEADQLPIPQINPPIQPAGYAFSIWGLIYGWLTVSALFGVLKRAQDPAWDVMRTPLILSLALGTPWLWVANQSAIWATVLIIAMAVPAVVAMLRAPAHDAGWARWPVSIYAGWLTAASCVSIGSTMAGYGILFDQNGWAYAGIALALALTLPVQYTRADAPGYGLTVIWASVGIIVANGTSLVSLEAALGIALIAGLLWSQHRAALPA
ncbi:tryptophan-rich sensory protein [Pseudooctadecabacter jejudonensis]|uniref:Uncharacterized protein n=1 Tax=Pseudooctadecabacter jejudonensis TaxID=1391910 RepID=A0A1Y5TCV5_9RHOB|nr:tryptophan-rich sensory protein [Pseudooctadecabacter jejudonensis]SLN59029.1 hypothetical protein PSJ8397_03127 [Pseudooctadecabacter jejudonensis]